MTPAYPPIESLDLQALDIDDSEYTYEGHSALQHIAWLEHPDRIRWATLQSVDDHGGPSVLQADLESEAKSLSLGYIDEKLIRFVNGDTKYQVRDKYNRLTAGFVSWYIRFCKFDENNRTRAYSHETLIRGDYVEPAPIDSNESTSQNLVNKSINEIVVAINTMTPKNRETHAFGKVFIELISNSEQHSVTDILTPTNFYILCDEDLNKENSIVRKIFIDLGMKIESQRVNKKDTSGKLNIRITSSEFFITAIEGCFEDLPEPENKLKVVSYSQFKGILRRIRDVI